MTTNPLHLYRALLRECSYLPHPDARTFIHDFVVSSYRRYVPEHGSKKSNLEHMSPERQIKLLHRGRSFLSTLCRANQGYTRPLEKVLKLTYGRSGTRKRTLIDELAISGETTTAVNTKRTECLEKLSPKWQGSSVILDLINSEVLMQDVLDMVKGNLRSSPRIPRETIWKKPLSENRVKNLWRKWFAKMLPQLQVPVPEQEWLRLRSLSNGDLEWPTLIKRRAPSLVSEEKQGGQEKIVLQGPSKDFTFEAYVDGRPHKITQRFMRRRMTRVLKNTPMTIAKQASEGFVFKWDDGGKKSRHAVLVPDREQAITLFGLRNDIRYESRPAIMTLDTKQATTLFGT